ncbi:response regulator [Nitrospira sp. Kam-Ns4a]
MLERLLGEHIQVRLDLGPDEAWTLIDPGQLDQVILNLAVNVRDAMPQGGTLTFQTGVIERLRDWPIGLAAPPGGRYVQLVVTDTGCGMDARTREHLFEPFFTTKAPGKGTGLGLATVYGIVKQHGGVITVESEPGLGSRFSLALPLADVRQGSQGSTEAAPSPPRPARVPIRTTILVVEDEESVRELIAGMLTQLGYRVLTAASGPAVLAAEYPERIDLLITDVIMPGMSGPELARQLQARNPGLPVLFLSGYPGEELARNGFMESQVAFLTKPFTKDELARAIQEALGRAVEGGGAAPGQ